MPISNAQLRQPIWEEEEGTDRSSIHPLLRQTIRDAILFGKIRELDDVLNVIALDTNFPETLRSGLESLRHYRAHYDKGGDMEPVLPSALRKKILLENAWGAELLNMLGE